ncbi:pyridoxal phosphate-dependent decarboxylase family protein [Georgenia alba]|uniref:Pyridoxal phosphate-dependent decarboxylase family protein n=1 Tax=Georgenia alba TaxID=2233858 RepID=A0ABW2QDU9_9MICO
MSDASLHHLVHPDNATELDAAIRSGLHCLTDQLTAVTRPATGRSPMDAALPVAGVDLDRPLPDLEAALAEVTQLWLRDAVWFHHPSYAAHLNCPVVIPTLVAEQLLTAVNSSMDTFDQSVGATYMERHLIDWTARRIGFGPGADGVFTSGGSQSNLQALVLARAHAAARGLPPERMRILASADSHFSVGKSAHVMGLPAGAVVPVPVGADRRMDVAELARLVRQVEEWGDQPMAVVATAGTTDFGAIDPVADVADVARTAGAWLHVDAAYGGGLLTSRRHRHRLSGVELADSVTVDYHKTFFQPVSSSAILVQDRQALRAVTWHADYLNPADSMNPNQVDKSLQTTRRFDALKLWMTLRVMGPDAIGDYLDAVIDLTEEVHAAISGWEDLELAAPPQLSTIVFRYAPPDTSERALAQLNTAIRHELYARGTAVVAATTVEGRQFLKLTLLNPAATREDVLSIVRNVLSVGRELSRDRHPATVGGAR